MVPFHIEFHRYNYGVTLSTSWFPLSSILRHPPRNRTLLGESYNQIDLYRNYLYDPTQSLWRHFLLGASGNDEGFGLLPRSVNPSSPTHFNLNKPTFQHGYRKSTQGCIPYSIPTIFSQTMPTNQSMPLVISTTHLPLLSSQAQ